nr:hypothetical protein [Tanacetum cinerariifolium]
PEWTRHVTIVHQTKDLHTADYTQLWLELLEPIPESHQVPQNDNDVISEDTSVEQGGETIEQHHVNFKETRALYESLYQNLAIEVEKVNSVNRKLKETNADLTTELARYKNQERCFKVSQEKYDKLKRCYQQSVYQEQCLSKKINALYLSTGKQIMTLNEQISDLNKKLSKEKSTVSFLLKEKKRLKSDFKTYEDKLLDKQIQLEKKIKELNNIVLKMGQSIQTIHMLSPKPDSFYHTEQKMALGYQNPFYLKQAPKKQQSLYDEKVLLEKHDPPVVHDSEETLQLAQESREKMKQMNKEIKPANYTKINHLSRVFVPQMALSREELYFSNNSKTANVSKSISITNEDFLDDTRPSVARKFLNEVKSTIVTLQRVVKQRMTFKTHNWSPCAYQELHKIVKDEIFPIVNQVDARLQNFKIQFLKEASKFVGDFKSFANEADASLVKHKALELEIERLLKVVVSQDIMIIVQKESVVDTSDLQTELEQAAKFVGDFISLPKEADASLAKHKILEMDIDRILKAVVSQDIISVVQNAFLLIHQTSKLSLNVRKNALKTISLKRKLNMLNFGMIGRSKHMTGNLKLLINFVWKFMGTVCFENDHVAAILGFGQFCDSNLEVAFRRNACFVRSLEGVDLLKGGRSTNLYTINLHEMASASPICLMARASSTKSWLWHQRLSHLNFDTINDLARNDLLAVVSQDIMIILQTKSVVDTSDLQTELERMKERFENCIIKKETEYAKL